MILRKMAKNKGLVACLLVGLLLTVALISGIPIYTNGVFQRMLVKDLEIFQNDADIYPGTYRIDVRLFPFYKDDIAGAFLEFEKKIEKTLRPQVDIPSMSLAQKLSFGYLEILRANERMRDSEPVPITLDALSNVEDHVEIRHGRMFTSEMSDGVYEVIVSEAAMKKLRLFLDEEYDISLNFEGGSDVLRARIVGVYGRASVADGFWFEDSFMYDQSFLIDYSVFKNKFIEENPAITQEGLTDAVWYYALDYGKIVATQLNNVLSVFERQTRNAQETMGTSFAVPMMPILERYNERSKRLQTILWFIQTPVLIILAFYLFMVSSLIIIQERNEIALLKSRGASVFQIMTTYLQESAILGAAALIIGPLVGYAVCTVIGFSNGFMQFIQRARLPISINLTAYAYALIAVFFSGITIVTPSILASRTTIVVHKQQLAKKNKPLWQRLYVDIIILAVVIYGYTNYKRQQSILFITGADAGQLPIDPLLFITSTLFIFGAGLFLIRLIPFVLKGLLAITRKFLSPEIYAALIQVARSKGQEQYLMLFLILTFATGLFSANMARTVNQNTEEQILYRIGADMILEPYWQREGESGIEQNSQGEQADPASVTYKEPPEMLFRDLDGVAAEAKVLRKERVRVFLQSDEAVSSELLAIVPHEFGKAAWFRNDLTNPHWHAYLNLLSDNPRAFIASSSFADEYGVLLGDAVSLTWAGQKPVSGVVSGFFEFWPSFIPYGERYAQEPPVLIVANLGYIQERTALEPYEIWIKKNKNASSAGIYSDLKSRDALLTDVEDAKELIIKELNDPLLQGLNGALTLNFLVIAMISILGFIIFWILSLRNRSLQFGVLRAIGLSRKSVIATVFNEQLFLAGLSIVFGFLCGELTSAIFVPLLQLTTDVERQVPPFKIVASLGDYAKLYAIAGAIVLLGLLLIMFFINHVKVTEALKLGED